MRKLFYLAAVAVLLCGCQFYSAEPNSIIGKWNKHYAGIGPHGEGEIDFTLSFSKDGEYRSHVVTDDMTCDVYARYTIEGNRLCIYESHTYDELEKQEVYLHDTTYYTAVVNGNSLYMYHEVLGGVYYERK